MVGAFELLRSPIPGTSSPHQCAIPESSTCPHAVGQLSLSTTLSHNPAMALHIRMEPLFYVALLCKHHAHPHRPLRRTPKTIVNEMDPTSVRSCPLSRTPLPLSPLVLLRLLTFRKKRQGPRPGWSCQIAQSEENGSPHMGGFKPRPGVMSLAVAWI